MSKMKMIVSVLLAAAFVLGVASPINAQGKGGFGKTETSELRAEIAKLRADLDAALREIRALKLAVAGGKAEPEEGQLYRGRPASSWLEQLKDANPEFRADAIDAIGALALSNKKLESVLLKTLKEDTDDSVGKKAGQALTRLGTDNLSALIEIAKIKKQEGSPFSPQMRAIEVIGRMKSKAKPAVPVIVEAFRDANDEKSLLTTILALTFIGPDASEAIPALIEKLDIGVQNMLKAEKSEHSDLNKKNTWILRTIVHLDPNLRNANVVPLNIESASFVRANILNPQPTLHQWQTGVDALKKHYVAKKQ
jgi:hypothetical protein